MEKYIFILWSLANSTNVLFICQVFIWLFVCPSIHLSVRPFVHSFVLYPSIRSTMHPIHLSNLLNLSCAVFFHLFIHLSTHPINSSIHSSIHLSILPSIHSLSKLTNPCWVAGRWFLPLVHPEQVTSPSQGWYLYFRKNCNLEKFYFVIKVWRNPKIKKKNSLHFWGELLKWIWFVRTWKSWSRNKDFLTCQVLSRLTPVLNPDISRKFWIYMDIYVCISE